MGQYHSSGYGLILYIVSHSRMLTYFSVADRQLQLMIINTMNIINEHL